MASVKVTISITLNHCNLKSLNTSLYTRLSSVFYCLNFCFVYEFSIKQKDLRHKASHNYRESLQLGSCVSIIRCLVLILTKKILITYCFRFSFDLLNQPIYICSDDNGFSDPYAVLHIE